MADWYYYDNNGNKLGPVTGRQLKELARTGQIMPETLIEGQDGQPVFARQAGNLTFLENGMEPPIDPALQSVPPPVPDTALEPFATMQPTEDMALIPPVLEVPEVKEEEVKESTLPLLSRAVFIFLAVFVGLFGVHDFYAKRVREGGIHLALLLPWILAIFVSIFSVFGLTLYAIFGSLPGTEVGKIQHALKAGSKEILEMEQKRSETARHLERAMAGERPIRPQQDEPKTPVSPQPDEQLDMPIDAPMDEPERPLPSKPDEPIEPQPPVNVDWKYVEELRSSLAEYDRLLSDLEQRRNGLEAELVSLKAQRGLRQMTAWVSTGPLWCYFFFGILPFVSWVMAMVEIVYVTKDGTGKPLGF